MLSVWPDWETVGQTLQVIGDDNPPSAPTRCARTGMPVRNARSSSARSGASSLSARKPARGCSSAAAERSPTNPLNAVFTYESVCCRPRVSAKADATPFMTSPNARDATTSVIVLLGSKRQTGADASLSSPSLRDGAILAVNVALAYVAQGSEALEDLTQLLIRPA